MNSSIVGYFLSAHVNLKILLSQNCVFSAHKILLFGFVKISVLSISEKIPITSIYWRRLTKLDFM